MGEWFLALTLAVCWLASGGQGYYFHPGYEHHYTYTAHNALQHGRPVTTILKFHINRLPDVEDLHSMKIDSYTQFMQGGEVMENPGKWDLSKTFLFKTNANGSVTLVHRHAQERHELLVVKKAIVGLFSVHLKTETEGNIWHYSVQETDHLGHLQHDYVAERTGRGLKVQRTHVSVDKAHRSHNKTLHYDHHGLLTSAESRDRVIVMDRSGGVIRKQSLPGEAEEHVTTSGDFPDIDASANVSVRFNGKRLAEQSPRPLVSALRAETLVHTPKPASTYTLERIQSNITQAFDCLHQFQNPESENRTVCVNSLRSLLEKLSKPDYRTFVRGQLGRHCGANDTQCHDDRLVLLDVVARIGDVISQEMLVTYVLSQQPSSHEELRRVFIHCAALQHPTEEFVEAVSAFCFGRNGEHHGTRTLTRTQSRACLAVGSVVKQLAGNGQTTRAERLASRLEAWLEEHGKGDSWLHKRNARDTDNAWTVENSEDENIGKAVLLHALGNGALEQSRPHLLQHARPNTGHHVWRRAALEALRHFSCEQSAQTLFNSVLHDEVYSVRRVALGVFAGHPQRHHITRRQEDLILRENYNYRAVARVKRQVFEQVLFQFKLALPKYEWNRELGNSKIGASFGVKFQNSIEGMFRVLQGYVDVDVHDKLFAEAHVGLVNLQLDLLDAEICYRGRLSYNMNLVKDFTVGLYEDINSAFDHIIGRVMEPMEHLANKLASEYQDAGTNTPKSGFQPLATAVKNMPKQTSTALQSTKEFSQTADLLGAMPLIKKLQALASRAQTLTEDVHSEASDLFANIADASIVALPFAEKEIRSNVNSVLNVLGKVKDYPNQAFAVMERAKMGYQLAMMRILEGSKILKQAFSFVSGGRSSWNGAGEEIKDIISQTKSLIAKLKIDLAGRKSRQASSNSDAYSECAKVEVGDAMISLFNKSEEMVTKLEIVTNNSPAELQRALDLMQTQTEILKASFASFKEAIDMIKSRIHALFGLRFHPSFPNQRRDCDDKCGCGYYPTDCKRYGHPGADLVWNKGWKVPSPVTGMAYVEKGGSAVRLEPKTSDMKEYQVFVSNIVLHQNFTNQTEFFIEAGQVFAFSNGDNGCNKGHIHVAMKRTSNVTGICHYVDPAPFLDTLQPVPTWHEECREFKFKHIGQVMDFDKLTEGWQPFLTELKRYALDSLQDLAIDKIGELIPDDNLLAPFKDAALHFLRNVNTSAGNMRNMFTPGWDAAKNFFNEIKQDFTFRGLMDMAADSNLLKLKLPQLSKMADTARKLMKIPKSLEKLKKLSVGNLGRLWKGIGSGNFSLPTLRFGGFSWPQFGGLSWPQFGSGGNGTGGFSLPSLNFKGLGKLIDDVGQAFNASGLEKLLASGKDELLSLLKTKLRDAVCPALGKLLAKHGSPCIPHDDCKGLSCDITIQRPHLTGRMNVDIRIDWNKTQVNITVDGKEYTAVGDEDKTIPTGLQFFNAFDVQFQLATLWNGDQVELSLILQACGPNLCCLPEITLAKNLTFSSFSLSAFSDLLNGTDVNLELLPLDTSYKVLTDLNVDSPELTDQMLGIKDIISESLGVELPADTQYSAEFKNPVDHKDSGSFPAAGQKAEVYVPFFNFEFPFPLGPVILYVRFGGGGVIGLTFDVKVRAVDSLMKTTVTPWVAAKLKAGVSLDIFVFAFGVDLHGWLMRTRFPLSLETNYTKQPVIQTKRLDVELVPLELKLVLWVEIKIQIRIKIGWVKITITLFHKRWSWTVWHWTSGGHSGTIWKKVSAKNDLGPPRFPYCDKVDAQCSSRRRRSVGSTSPVCMVSQLKGRHPKNPAFLLDFSVSDDDSDLDVTYAIGDYPGGSNIVSWTRMQGSSLMVPGNLPCGKPLYFSVRASNTQGLDSTALCSLPTYDCSVPDGRVDASYRCTSHPSKLSATVVVYEDSVLQANEYNHAVGYSPSSYGHEVVDWLPLDLSNTAEQSGVVGNLRYFTAPRPGRLASTPKHSLRTATAADCAIQCLNDFTCISFSFSQLLYSCELQTVTEGVFAKRVEDQHFLTYERLGVGKTGTVVYRDLPLQHGVLYYINAAVENVLGYQSVLTSKGTMADHTPPEPGYLGVGAVETMVAERCSASVGQRCMDITDMPNHRKIVDGRGGSTVFNGNRRGQDLTYTIENHHAAANWAGFQDRECGIYSFLWAVGTSVCGTQVANFTDPHLTMLHRQDWSHMGLVKGLHLAEGPYYVTVQAISDIIHGGDLVTTVCHSQPFIVDITSPVVHGVNEVLFDDTFRFLAVYYNATDALSGISRVEFGLGRTKYDVFIRRYLPFEMRGAENNTYLLNEEFETASGVSAWVRIKAVDNVRLSATGFGNTPILLDSTPPMTGEVMDGDKLGQDVCCQGNGSSLCAQWRGFEDPESHIDSFLWGIGSAPGKDDIIAFHRLSNHDRRSCMSGLNLEHNSTYFSTIVVYNKALNQKSSNISSDGVLVDLTPPLPGIVVDGDNVSADIDFTSHTASLSAAWKGFHDPETQIDSYTLSVFVQGSLAQKFTDINPTLEHFTDHSFSFQHGDRVHSEVTGMNRAGRSVTVASSGMSVDHTPPILVSMGPSHGLSFQQSDTSLNFVWQFEDSESGVVKYRYKILQVIHGQKTQIWPPAAQGEEVIELNGTATMAADTTYDLLLQSLQLTNGASYSVKVTAINGAKMAAVEESVHVTVDTTPPLIQQFHISAPGEEEEVNEDGEIEHIEGELLPASWVAYDFESGLTTAEICVGPLGADCLSSSASLTLSVSPSNTFMTMLNDSHLAISTDTSKVVYQASLVVTNGAGSRSTVARSKPIIVLRGNVAGVVLDGRTGADEDFTFDKSSIAATFSGFSSQACGIVGFEWGVGSTPCATDILPYSQLGLVRSVAEEGSGKAQAHLLLGEGARYYVAVRAKTGYNCHEPYIVSCSDGISIDTTPPKVSFRSASDVGTPQILSKPSDPLTFSSVIYQANGEKLMLGWEVEDPSGVNDTGLSVDRWAANPVFVPANASSSHPFPLGYPAGSGDSIFPSLRVSDVAGNEDDVWLPAVIVDSTAPVFVNLECTDIVSIAAPQVTCTWDSVDERDGTLETLALGIGSGPALADVYPDTPVSLREHQWVVDVNTTFLRQLRQLYVIARASNAARMEASETVVVLVDASPPTVDGVTIVTSSGTGGSLVAQRCQSSQDFVEVELTGMSDAESGLYRVEIALGSSSGTSDIQAFKEYERHGAVYAQGQLALTAGTTIFATARVMNGAGLYTVLRSEGVVVSPNPRLEVWDGTGERDVDGQADVNMIQGVWRFSDPCPILSAEWAVVELTSGQYVRHFTPIPDGGRAFYDDTLLLENMKTYVNHVRVVDAQNRTFSAYSDGVTVANQPPDTAAVWEGTGSHNQDYQESLHHLSASWDPFGDAQSVLPSQHIVRYEVAVGTDRRWHKTRTNVHGFQEVGLSQSHTFQGLNLTAKTVQYFVTVRAYSAAGTFSESSSDGIRAGYSGEILPGQVTVDPFQSDTSSIRASWDGFLSDIGEMRYYIGVSTLSPPFDNATYDCPELLNSTFQFDVQSLQSVNSEALTSINHLMLQHKGTYFVTVIAEDLMLHCTAATSDPVLVDVTPPVRGEINTDGYDSVSAIFIHSTAVLTVNLDTFPDDESGIQATSLQLMESQGCGLPSDTETLIRRVEVGGEQHVTLRNLNLQQGKVHLIRATITNGAGLSTTATSKPLLLDIVPPTLGAVRLGTKWTGVERLFQNETDSLEGMIAIASFNSSATCLTQTELLSGPYRDSWLELGGKFSLDSVFIQDSSIVLLVQHNSHLTGINKGAVQLANLTWRDGDYTLRLAPAAGLNILTGVSLASPSLAPPFLSQNGLPLTNKSAWTCSSAAGGCDEGQGDVSGEGTLLPDGEYGVGLSFLEVNGSMKALFWAQDRIRLKQTLLTFDSDPSAAVTEYIFRLRQLTGESWEISLLVNGEIQAAFSGVVLPDAMTMTLYTWNVEGYDPTVNDPFKPFRTFAEILRVAMPVADRPLCFYGAPFQDSQSGVKEVWAGVSNSLNETANVAPFRLLKSYCSPCLHGCHNLCSAACPGDMLPASDFNIVSLALSNLTLDTGDGAANSSSASLSQTGNTSTADELDKFEFPIYYMDVRIVAHSGLFADAKSSPVVVDVSPPVVSDIFCIDPPYASDEPVEYVGNNHTVGLRWDVSEDVTDIVRQWVAIGSQPYLDDIVPWKEINRLARQHTLTDLAGLLQDGTTYHFNLRVINQASLVTSASANFTVLTSPPDMSVLSPAPANVTSVVNVSGIPMAFTDSTDRVAVRLSPSALAANSTVRWIEWMIGTQPGKQDIFPKTIVANTDVSEVGIVQGHVAVDGVSTNISVGDYVRSSFAPSDNQTAAVFLMEPGRCLQQKILGVTKSHQEAAVDVAPLCILRSDDTLVLAGKMDVLLPPKDPSSTGADTDVKVTAEVKTGGLAVGSLGRQDLDAMYGTAASTDFSPFIINPDPAQDATSRFLRGRLLSFPGPHLYLSPVGQLELAQDVDINYNVSTSAVIPAGATVKFIFWDADAQEWKSLEDLCPPASQSFDSTSRELIAKVCPEVFSGSSIDSNRVKRSVPGPPPATYPRMVTVAVVTAFAVNSPPMVQNVSLLLHEDDEGYSTTITYTDHDDDVLEFAVLQPAQSGRASVTPQGRFFYQPNPNFFGEDVVVVQATELLDAASLSAGAVPYVVNISVTIVVADANDPPELFYVTGVNNSNVNQQLVVGPTAGTGINMSVLVEGNTTTFTDLGLVVFGDIDDNDTIIFMNMTNDSPDATFSVKDVSTQDRRLAAYNVTSAPSGVGAKEISLSLAKGYWGNVVYEARVRDAANSYSLQLSLYVHVMISPCIHGHCQAHAPGQTCSNWQRAHTFDPFLCHCDPGYEGQWCEIETDECRSATCSPVTDCVDLVNGYRCDPNLEKTLAISVCSLVAVILITIGIYKCKMRQKSRMKISDSTDDLGKPVNASSNLVQNRYDADGRGDDEDPASARSPFVIPRPQTSSSASDVFLDTSLTSSPGRAGSLELEEMPLSSFMPVPSLRHLLFRPLKTTALREPAPDYPPLESKTSFQCKKGDTSDTSSAQHGRGGSSWSASEDISLATRSTQKNKSYVAATRELLEKYGLFKDISGGTLRPPRKSQASAGAQPVVYKDREVMLPPIRGISRKRAAHTSTGGAVEEDDSLGVTNPGYSSFTGPTLPREEEARQAIWRPIHSQFQARSVSDSPASTWNEEQPTSGAAIRVRGNQSLHHDPPHPATQIVMHRAHDGRDHMPLIGN